MARYRGCGSEPGSGNGKHHACWVVRSTEPFLRHFWDVLDNVHIRSISQGNVDPRSFRTLLLSLCNMKVTKFGAGVFCSRSVQQHRHKRGNRQISPSYAGLGKHGQGVTLQILISAGNFGVTSIFLPESGNLR